MKRSTVGTLLGILSIFFWSTTIAFGRRLTESVGILSATSTAFLISGILTCCFWSLHHRSPTALFRYRRSYLTVCGGLFALYVICLYGAIGASTSRQQVFEVGIINYLWPALILVFSVPVLRVRARPTLWLGILLAMSGAVLALAQQGELSWTAWQRHVAAQPLPYVLAFVGAIAWALYSNLSRRLGPGAGIGGQPLFVLGTGILLLFLRMAVHESPRWTPEALALLAYNIVFPITLAYAFWDYAVRTGRIVLLASLSYMTPVLSTGVSAVLLQMAPGTTLWVACALVIAGAGICKMSVQEGRD